LKSRPGVGKVNDVQKFATIVSFFSVKQFFVFCLIALIQQLLSLRLFSFFFPLSATEKLELSAVKHVVVKDVSYTYFQ
jgi:hypothetical protein